MKDLAGLIAIAMVAPLAIWTPARVLAAPRCAAPPTAADLAYPDFCDIPVTPTDVRSASTFKAAVIRTRAAGAGLIARTAPETFTLTGTENFEAESKRAATLPPPVTAPGEPDTAAFAAAARAKATPPRRPH
jgi:hypothetical protein